MHYVNIPRMFPECRCTPKYYLRPSGHWLRNPLRSPHIIFDVLSVDDITAFLATPPNAHLQAKLGWVLKCRWNGVMAIAWSPDVRGGRLPWGDTGDLLQL